MSELRKKTFVQLSSKKEEMATISAEQKFGAAMDLEAPIKSQSTFSRLPLHSFDSKVPIPEPSPIGFEPSHEIKEKEKMKFSFDVFKYSTKFDKFLLFLAILMNLANGATMPIFMLVFGDLINSVGDPQPGGIGVNYYVLLQVYIGIAAFFLSSIGFISIDVLAERQIRQLRHHYLKAVLNQEMGWFDTYDAGTLATRLNQNCISIRDGIGIKMGQLFMFGAMFVGGYIVGFIRGWKMTLVLTAALPLLAAAGFFMMFLLSAAENAAHQAYAKAGSVAEEVLGNIRSVVAFGSEAKSMLRYEVHLDESMRAGMKSGLATGLGLGLTLFVMFLSYSLGFWYGGQLVAESLESGCVGTDCFRGGNALTVFFAVIIASFSLGQAGPPLTSYMKAGAAVEDLLSLVNRESKIDPSNEVGQKDIHIQGAIEFKNVHFSYPSRTEKPIFAGLDLKIEPGESVALVGGSGCGKSTIIQLVQRFYDPDKGQILIDGIDIKDYNIKWLRDQMSLVIQEPRLFARSIAENIRDGRLNATLQDVEEAAKNANALNFIAQFPDGLDTFVGEGGSQLSGGQKQRIAIARAMLRNPSILILDEATSALDNESEKIVQTTLEKLLSTRKRTTITIAHRLSTIKNADKIVVLDSFAGLGARVVEIGTHDQLMAIEDGIYQTLIEAQRLQGVIALSASARASRSASRETSLMKSNSKIAERNLSKLLPKTSKGEAEFDLHKVTQTFEQISTETVVKSPPRPPSYTRVLKLLGPYKLNVAIGVVASMAAGLVFPAFAIIFSEFTSVYYLHNPDDIRNESAFWACMFIVLAVGCLISTFLQRYFMEQAGQHLVRELRAQLFERILYQDMSFFDDPDHSTGSLSQVLSSDALMVKGWSGDNLSIVIQNASALIAAIIIAFISSPKLAAVSLAAFMVVIPAGALEMQFMKGSASEIKEGAKTAGYVINETITNMRIVTAYNLQQRMLDTYDTVLANDYTKGEYNAVVGGLFFGFSQFIQFGAQALTLWYGSQLMQRGEITDFAAMMRAIFALLMASMGIGQSIIFLTDVKKAREGGARVYEIIDRIPLIDARSTLGKELIYENITGDVSIKDVNFRYPQRPDIPVFRNISFEGKSGQTIALVGASGCGKSTIIQLLERFYDVQGGTDKSLGGGSVCVDGLDVRDATVKSLRSILGLVSQEPVLFNTTIAENIRYGKPGATDNQIVEAAKLSNAHQFIMQFPEGYGTLVGKFGGQLSGGQKQRIAIARAIIRNPKILLLDEATSALDAESEKVVQAALDQLLATSKRTTIVIAHRLSTIQNADMIVVLANPDRFGSMVVESGTHHELMEIPDGIYKSLVRIATVSQRRASRREDVSKAHIKTKEDK